MTERRISIHVPSRNRHWELSLLLHSLRHQTVQSWDVLILDDASGNTILGAKPIQDIITRLKLEGHDVQVIRNDFSTGVCRARQQLVDADPWKENPYIVRLDDDCILEPDYLEKLHEDMEWDRTGEKLGIVSGVTPLFGAPPFVRESRFVEPIVNKVEFDKDGNLVTYNDDCGLEYDKGLLLPAHQFRSMAMFRREVFDKVKYPQGLSPVGFREEAWVSLQAAWEGWKCMVDLGAVAWHAPCPTGGTRSSPQEYQKSVFLDDERFRKWAKEQYLKKGVPAVWK